MQDETSLNPPDTETLFDALSRLYSGKAIRAIDKQFGYFIGELLGDMNAPLVGWAALLSFELGKGNVCIDLALLDPLSLFDLPAQDAAYFSSLLHVEKALDTLSCSSIVSAGERPTPLVLYEGRLYLHRNWLSEQKVAKEIKKRAQEVPLPPHARAVLDALFRPDIETLKHQFSSWNEAERFQKLVDFFDLQDVKGIDFEKLMDAIPHASPETVCALVPVDKICNWQKIAAASALSSRFAVISGGPGTGKTTTVAKLLAALVSCSDLNAKAGTPPLEIKLVAPTGKAANRLTQSLCRALEALPISPEVRAQIPSNASTIHRLLGVIPQRVEFRHHQENLLHLDVLVVDEASMVDLSLMAKLLCALPPHARVILLGDRDQLASVEAGAVLGDICLGAKNAFTPKRAQKILALTGTPLLEDETVSSVTDGVCLLRKSYRFDAYSGIGQLAHAINQGNKWTLEKVFEQDFDDIFLHDWNQDVYSHAIEQAMSAYRPYLSALLKGASHEMLLTLFSQARVLCALTQGPFGVSGLNLSIEHALTQQKLISPGNDIFYPGRPIMVTQNDHALGLYNGDIGIVVKERDGLRVVFEMSDGMLNAFLPSRLPEHQTAYAMTIHKSQGSEFDHTLLILPPGAMALMTRELLYTGITRAKKRLDLYATRLSLVRAMKQKTQRLTGLSSALGVRNTQAH